MTEIAIVRLEYERKRITDQIERLGYENSEKIEKLREKLREKQLDLDCEIERLKAGFYEFVPSS